MLNLEHKKCKSNFEYSIFKKKKLDRPFVQKRFNKDI